MPDSEHPLLKQAFQHAESCYAEANAIVDFLDQATENLQEEERSYVRRFLSRS
jgi:hypothetical protein